MNEGTKRFPSVAKERAITAVAIGTLLTKFINLIAVPYL